MTKSARTARMYVLYFILLAHLSGSSTHRQVNLVRKAAELLETHQLRVHLFISFPTYAGFIADERSTAGAAVGVGDGEVGAGFRAL